MITFNKIQKNNFIIVYPVIIIKTWYFDLINHLATNETLPKNLKTQHPQTTT